MPYRSSHNKVNNELPSTFDHIFRTHYQTVYRHVYWIVLSHEDAEQITQDTFVEWLETLSTERYTDPTHIRHWLHRKARHRAIDWKRRLRSYVGHLLQIRETEPTQREPDQTWELAQLLKELSASERDVLALSAQGYKSPEIAQMINKSPTTVRQRLHRAQQKLLALQHKECDR